MTNPILFKEDSGQRRYELDWVRIGAFMLLIPRSQFDREFCVPVG
jgi:hypothetical protein